jgi:hypothetical protein
MSDGLTLTVTFVSNSVAKGITFTSPTANSQVTTRIVTLGGKITSLLQAPQVSCQVFQNYAPLTGFMPATVTATNWSVRVTNLTGGTYSAVAIATDASGRTASASDTFTVNFYPSLAGTYHGLFFAPGNITQSNAGSITFKLSSTGVVNGSLTFPVANYPLALQMGSTGSGIALLYGGLGALDLTMIFDTANFSGQMTGFVTTTNGQSPLTAYRTMTKLSGSTTPVPGKYVLSLEPVTPTNGIVDGPLGDGYAAVNVSAGGSLAVAGTMADNTPFSLSTGVFTNGVWPLYANLFKGGGMLIGWETNVASGTCAGALFWLKGTNGIYYPDGVQEDLTSIGAKYVPPTPGTQYQIVFGGGPPLGSGPPPPPLVENLFSFNAAGAIVPVAGTSNHLTGSLLSTGVLSKGSILNPANNQLLKFSGVFVGPTLSGGFALQGAGFTLDTGTQTGYFEINSVPPPP